MNVANRYALLNPGGNESFADGALKRRDDFTSVVERQFHFVPPRKGAGHLRLSQRGPKEPPHPSPRKKEVFFFAPFVLLCGHSK